MNVADLNASCKSALENCDSIQELHEAIDSIAHELQQAVHSAAEEGESFDFVERKVRATVYEIGKQAADLFIALQGDGDWANK